jgi:aminoglycoside phosphotransferase (APT) family kinase protein
VSAAISAVIARHLPDYRVETIAALGQGLDHTAYEVNGELIVRRSHEPRAAAVEREATLLKVVRDLSPLPVPDPVFVDPDAGVIAYRKLPGAPLLDHPVPDSMRLATPLGEFVASLHQTPTAWVEPLAPAEAYPLADRLNDAADEYEQAAAAMPATARRSVETFLAAALPPEPDAVAFCHNDLGAEHILVDIASHTITGVIDWSDAAITDPAIDFARAYRDLGPPVAEAMLAHHRGPSVNWERVAFYARCALIEDIAYGLRTGDRRYTDTGLAHLSRTYG